MSSVGGIADSQRRHSDEVKRFLCVLLQYKKLPRKQMGIDARAIKSTDPSAKFVAPSFVVSRVLWDLG
jgi:hypothetical protein